MWKGRCSILIFSDPGRLHIFYLGICKVFPASLGAPLLVLLQVQLFPFFVLFQFQPYETSAGTASPKCTRFVSTLPETNMAHENPFFPGKYHQNGGFPMGMLVYRSVPIRHWKLLPRNDFFHMSDSLRGKMMFQGNLFKEIVPEIRMSFEK